MPRPSSCACSTPTGARETRAPAAARRAAATSGTATCRGAGAGLVYGLRAHGPWRPRAGPPLQPAQAAARPLCARDRRPASTGSDAHFAADRDAPAAHGHARQRRHGAEGPRRARPLRLAAATRPPATPLVDSVLYEVHVRGFTQAAPRRARGAARHLRRPGLGRGHRAPAAPGHHRREPAAGAAVPRRGAAGRAWACATTGATTRSASSAVEPRYASGAGGAAPRDEFRAHGARGCTRPASR